MKQFILIYITMFICSGAEAQKIKSFEIINVQKATDSQNVIYNLKITFSKFLEEDERTDLIKTELKKRNLLNPDRIISIKYFLDKRPMTYRVRLIAKGCSS